MTNVSLVQTLVSPPGVIIGSGLIVYINVSVAVIPQGLIGVTVIVNTISVSSGCGV